MPACNPFRFRPLFCHSLVPILLVMLAVPSAATAQGTPSATRGGSAAVATNRPTLEDWVAKRHETEKRLSQVQQQRDQLLAQNASAALPQWLVDEIELLQFLELVYAQRESTTNQLRELGQETRKQHQQLEMLRSVGAAEERPYSFLLLDQLRDELAGELARQDGFRAEIEAAEQLQQTVRKNYEDAERKRRQVREALENNDDPQREPGLQRSLELAELYSEVLSEVVGLRLAEMESAKRSFAFGDLKVTYLREKIEIVEPEAAFSQQDLDTIVSGLATIEKKLRKDVAQTREELKCDEHLWLEAQHELERHSTNREAAEEKVRALQTARESHQLMLSLLNQRMANLVVVRHVWNRRFRLANQTLPDEQYAEWLRDARAFIQRITRSAERSNLQVREGRLQLATLEKQLAVVGEENLERKKWIEHQMATLRKVIDVYSGNLIDVDRIERLLKQYEAELTVKTGGEQTDWTEKVIAALKTCWNYELTSVDDRPITVRKIVAGLVLLLGGYFVSRRLSRLLGNRILPRLGLDSGVTTAFQSIAFYALLVIFSLFSLQLLSIPVTIFAFLGGAIAIGVGFGSQNILNNFISGLILLAERPIRVGDLIEIDGLHGNVEKIGARSTRVKTGSNLEIIVPNSSFLENNVTNLTLSDTRIRRSVSVGVAYGSPTRNVDRFLRQAVASHPEIHPTPEPIVLFQEFGDNSLAFEVHFWLHAQTIMQARKIESEVRHTIDDLFREADIVIAFPQRDIHLNTTRPIEVNLRAVGNDAENVSSPLLQQRRAA